MAGLKGSSDPELAAISKIMRILDSLESEDQVLRVLGYIRMRFLEENRIGVIEDSIPRVEIKSCD